MNLARMIDILERAKHEHYTSRSGLNDCESLWGSYTLPCSCGAAETNGEIDEVIAELKKIGDAFLAEPIVITQPPGFSDDDDRQRCR